MVLIELYTKPNCNFCLYCRKLLEEKKLAYVEYKLSEDFTREQIVEKFPLQNTYPIVVWDGWVIGGYSELEKQLNEQNKPTTEKLLLG